MVLRPQCLGAGRCATPQSSGTEKSQVQGFTFVRCYNLEEHRHSKIRFVTPHRRHDGLDMAIMEKRTAIYEEARRRNPRRWSGQLR